MARAKRCTNFTGRTLSRPTAASHTARPPEGMRSAPGRPREVPQELGATVSLQPQEPWDVGPVNKLGGGGGRWGWVRGVGAGGGGGWVGQREAFLGLVLPNVQKVAETLCSCSLLAPTRYQVPNGSVGEKLKWSGSPVVSFLEPTP